VAHIRLGGIDDRLAEVVTMFLRCAFRNTNGVTGDLAIGTCSADAVGSARYDM
jgi:hypothetical protein